MSHVSDIRPYQGVWRTGCYKNQDATSLEQAFYQKNILKVQGNLFNLETHYFTNNKCRNLHPVLSSSRRTGDFAISPQGEYDIIDIFASGPEYQIVKINEEGDLVFGDDTGVDLSIEVNRRALVIFNHWKKRIFRKEDDNVGSNPLDMMKYLILHLSLLMKKVTKKYSLKSQFSLMMLEI